MALLNCGFCGFARHKVTQLVDRDQPAGTYSVSWKAENQSSGIYFVILYAVNSSGEYLERQKPVLLK